MRAARWVVIGTAIVAAATAFHMLMTPDGGSGSRAGARSGALDRADRGVDRPRSDGRPGGLTGPITGRGSAGDAGRGASGGPTGGGPPLDEIDAESREAMRNFLRESARDGK